MINLTTSNPSSLEELRQKQKVILIGAISALIFSTTWVLIAYSLIPLPLPALDTIEQRLIFTLRCQI